MYPVSKDRRKVLRVAGEKDKRGSSGGGGQVRGGKVGVNAYFAIILIFIYLPFVRRPLRGSDIEKDRRKRHRER